MPKTYPPPLSLRLSPELEKALRDEADSLGLGLSEVLRRRIISGSTGEPERTDRPEVVAVQ